MSGLSYACYQTVGALSYAWLLILTFFVACYIPRGFREASTPGTLTLSLPAHIRPVVFNAMLDYLYSDSIDLEYVFSPLKRARVGYLHMRVEYIPCMLAS